MTAPYEALEAGHGHGNQSSGRPSWAGDIAWEETQGSFLGF